MRRTRSTTLAGAACCTLAWAALLGGEERGWELATPAPLIDIRPARLEGLEALDCTRCHREVVEEWAASAHGLAWVDEDYREALAEKRRPEQCHDCHIPKNLLDQGALAAVAPRAERLELGVFCDTCHLGPGGAQLGPRGAPTAAHPSQSSELHTLAGSDALCIVCHAKNIGPVIGIAKDYEQDYKGKPGAVESCIACHMAPVERRWAQPAEGEQPPPVRIGRSHALQTPRDPAFLRQAFDVAVERAGEGALVRVTNRAGHRVPGLIGREIAFKAEALDAAGKALAAGELELTTRHYLPVGGAREIRLERAGVAVRVVGRHDEPRAKRPVEFLDLRLPVE